MKKWSVLICFLFLGGAMLFPSVFSSSLGLSPALVEVNFKPGLNFSVTYNVLALPSQKLTTHALGDFNDSVTFDKQELFGGQQFTANIKLPSEALKVGKNRLFVGVGEFIDEEEGEGIGTRLEVNSLILIHVPYPGKYAEITSFSVKNVNKGEPLNVILEVINRGKENLSVHSYIDVYSGDKKIDTLELGTKPLETEQLRKFKGTFQTNNYAFGNYKLVAIADYGGQATSEKEVKIGEMFVNITNYTRSFESGKINKFLIEVESLWNSKIDNLFAEVRVTKEDIALDVLKTPSLSLDPWKKVNLEGYLNAENSEIGEYKAEITLFYGNETTTQIVSLNATGRNLVMYAIIGVILIIAVLILFFVLRRMRNGNKKR